MAKVILVLPRTHERYQAAGIGGTWHSQASRSDGRRIPQQEQQRGEDVETQAACVLEGTPMSNGNVQDESGPRCFPTDRYQVTHS